jgi:hypothetical protein
MSVLEIPVEQRLGDLPSEPGRGANVMAVQSFFQGFPSDIRDARDLLDARSIAPAFYVWCGESPYVDFTNATVLDSMGREAPTVLCLPFLNPTRMMPAHTCTPVLGVPTGRYYQGGGLALRITGSLAIRSESTRTFAWGHDDGFSFRFGSVSVFEYPDPTGSRVDRRAVHFAQPGLYPFTLEWYDTIGGALLDWYVADNNATEGAFDSRFSLITPDDLHTSVDAPCTADCRRCEGATPVCDRSARRCVTCTQDSHCPTCQTCESNLCVSVLQTQGRDAAPTCLEPDDAMVDVATDGVTDAMVFSDRDVSLDASVASGQTGGCACGTQMGAWRGQSLWMILSIVVIAKRRRRPN